LPAISGWYKTILDIYFNIIVKLFFSFKKLFLKIETDSFKKVFVLRQLFSIRKKNLQHLMSFFLVIYKA
jgi:hypothetical protein